MYNGWSKGTGWNVGSRASLLQRSFQVMASVAEDSPPRVMRADESFEVLRRFLDFVLDIECLLFILIGESRDQHFRFHLTDAIDDAFGPEVRGAGRPRRPE